MLEIIVMTPNSWFVIPQKKTVSKDEKKKKSHFQKTKKTKNKYLLADGTKESIRRCSLGRRKIYPLNVGNAGGIIRRALNGTLFI